VWHGLAGRCTEGAAASIMESIILTRRCRGGTAAAEPERPQHAGHVFSEARTPSQQAKHLDRILTSDDTGCQCFSEPNAFKKLDCQPPTRAVLDATTTLLNGRRCGRALPHVAPGASSCSHLSDPGPAQGITFCLLRHEKPRPHHPACARSPRGRVSTMSSSRNVRVPAATVVLK